MDGILDAARIRLERLAIDQAEGIAAELAGAEGMPDILEKSGSSLSDVDFAILFDGSAPKLLWNSSGLDGAQDFVQALGAYALEYVGSKEYELSQPLSGLISLDGQPCLAAVTRLPAGAGAEALLIGNIIDDFYLDAIGIRSAHGRTTDVVDIAEDPAGYSRLFEQNGTFWVERESDETVLAGKFVRDIFGRRAFLYRVRIPRESMIQGRAVLGYFIFFLVLSGILMGVVLFLQLEHNFFAPLIHVGKRLNKIGADGDLSERINYSGSDEIHALTKDIDNMLLALETSNMKLSGSELHFQELFNNIKSGVEIYSIDESDGSLILEDVNAAGLQIAGLDYETVNGCNLLDIYPGLRGTHLLECILKVRDTGVSISLEPTRYEGEHLSGWREYQIYKLPSMKVVVVCDDVTPRMEVAEELNQKQLELNQSQKMEAIGRLAGGIAHDFNNILTVVNGVSEILLISMDDENEMRGDIEEINAAGQRAAELTSQLLAFSRRQIMKTRVLDMDEVIGNIRKMLKRLIGEAIELKVVQSREDALVLADSGQMEQVLVNLVLNSRDAMPDGGCLEIETSVRELQAGYIARHVIMESVKPESGSYVVIKVSDNGSGIKKDLLPKICDPFFTTKEEGKGTGLGLSTTYGIIRQSNGYMWFESEPGHGTVCTICLPEADKSQSGKQREAHRSDLPRCSETILLAEDEADLRDVIRRFLEHLGCTVLVASSAEEAIEIEANYSENIDLLLLDIIMPGMNGPDLWEYLQTKRDGVKAIFITGYENENAVGQALEQGCHIVMKPFNMFKLVAEIRAIMDAEQS
jgi:two-component system, cell cycle sensor histidine kinase and response regulator CckA